MTDCVTPGMHRRGVQDSRVFGSECCASDFQVVGVEGWSIPFHPDAILLIRAWLACVLARLFRAGIRLGPVRAIGVDLCFVQRNSIVRRIGVN